MSSFIQILVSGLATGAIYALIAVGFTLLWQTSQTINFAQGEFVMLPAFFILAAMNAGAAIYVSGLCKTFKDGIERARHVIQDGEAKRKLDEFVQFTQKLKGK